MFNYLKNLCYRLTGQSSTTIFIRDKNIERVEGDTITMRVITTTPDSSVDFKYFAYNSMCQKWEIDL